MAKKHKQNAARDRNYGEYAEISKLLDKIRSVGMGGISADDDLAVEKLTKKLEGLESLQATMKAVNAYETPARLFRPTPLIPKIGSREFISLYPLNLSSLNLPIPVSTFVKVFNRHSKFLCRIHDCLLYLFLLSL